MPSTVIPDSEAHSVTCQNVTIIDDNSFEITETFSVKLATSHVVVDDIGVRVGAVQETKVFIEDDDEGNLFHGLHTNGTIQGALHHM